MEGFLKAVGYTHKVVAQVKKKNLAAIGLYYIFE